MPNDQRSNPLVFSDIPKSDNKRTEERELSKLQSAIKLIKSSDISQSEIAKRFDIEPEYAKILSKHYRK